MTTTNAGLAWHVHHDQLVEWCYDFAGRVAYIKAEKPANEVPTRLRLFQLVRNPPAAISKARAACDEAWAARVKAWAVYEEAWAACGEAWAAYDEAGAAISKAGAARAKAWAVYDEARTAAMPELIALHAVECPGCPWDGETIFPAVAR